MGGIGSAARARMLWVHRSPDRSTDLLPMPSFLLPPANRGPRPALTAAAKLAASRPDFRVEASAFTYAWTAFTRRFVMGPTAMHQISARNSSERDDRMLAWRSSKTRLRRFLKRSRCRRRAWDSTLSRSRRESASSISPLSARPASFFRAYESGDG